jgi:hypothetical protein
MVMALLLKIASSAGLMLIGMDTRRSERIGASFLLNADPVVSL